jgi:phosphosulfolactate phosphohydrolase-like enzyme
MVRQACEGAMIESLSTHDQTRSAEVSLVSDVLRAATSVVQALVGGCERVPCAHSRERAQAPAARDASSPAPGLSHR